MLHLEDASLLSDLAKTIVISRPGFTALIGAVESGKPELAQGRGPRVEGLESALEAMRAVTGRG